MLSLFSGTGRASDSVFEKQLSKEATAHGFEEAAVVVYRFGTTVAALKAKVSGFRLDRPIALASSSKWVTAATILTLVDQGKLSLDDTVGKWLKWTGSKAGITVGQLLSFTSGITAEASCTRKLRFSLASCVESMRSLELTGPPGRVFEYGSTHMQIAGRIAELASGMSWHELFERNIRAPLGLSPKSRYYRFPKQRLGSGNAALAMGLVMSTEDYLKFLMMIANDGASVGKTVLSKAMIQEMKRDRFRPDTKVLRAPMKVDGNPYHYALGNWVECPTGPSSCATSQIRSSGGLYGFFPWIDWKNRYFAVLAIEDDALSGQKSFEIVLKLRPEIEKRLAEK